MWLIAKGIQGEIVVVDDGSADQSFAILSYLQEELPHLVLVRHPKNQGYGSTARSGCDHASMETIAIMDSDGQFHVADFEKLLPLLREVDFVSGIRKKRADPFFRLVNAWLYGQLVRIVLGVRVRDINCSMKVFRRSVWPKIRPQYATGALIYGEVFFRLRRENIPFRQAYVSHYERKAGYPTGARFFVVLRMFRDLWRLKRALWKEKIAPSSPH